MKYFSKNLLQNAEKPLPLWRPSRISKKIRMCIKLIVAFIGFQQQEQFLLCGELYVLHNNNRSLPVYDTENDRYIFVNFISRLTQFRTVINVVKSRISALFMVHLHQI
jgi:hypothetical protein